MVDGWCEPWLTSMKFILENGPGSWAWLPWGPVLGNHMVMV